MSACTSSILDEEQLYADGRLAEFDREALLKRNDETVCHGPNICAAHFFVVVENADEQFAAFHRRAALFFAEKKMRKISFNI